MPRLQEAKQGVPSPAVAGGYRILRVASTCALLSLATSRPRPYADVSVSCALIDALLAVRLMIVTDRSPRVRFWPGRMLRTISGVMSAGNGVSERMHAGQF